MSGVYEHISVMQKSLIAGLALQPGAIVVDCTLGGCGHTMELLHSESVQLVVGIDQDGQAIENANQKLKAFLAEKKVILEHRSFSELRSIAEKHDLVGKINGIIADIGVSSVHLDQADRGFSFHADGPLDMRMNRDNQLSAAEVVNTFAESQLADIFYKYGEEPKSRILARRICERREEAPFTTTFELAEFVKANLFYKTKSRKHPATKAFQALRIFVNDELGQLEKLLSEAPKLLAPKGRLGIITFHSLEDRMVKQAFRRLADLHKPNLPRDIPSISAPAEFQIIKPFPTKPSDEEVAENPRARSAKLRFIEKCQGVLT